MKQIAQRPFRLLDLMILVVAFGPVFLIRRDRYDYYRVPRTPAVYQTENIVLAVANGTLTGLTLAFTAFALRGPRPSFRLTLRRPGPAACTAACAAIVVVATRLLAKVYATYALTGPPFEPFQVRYVYPWLVGSDVRIGFAVGGAWLALLITRGWRPARSWIDRGGRVVGCGWLSLELLHVPRPWIEPFLPAI
jgi:hypothetical protein